MAIFPGFLDGQFLNNADLPTDVSRLKYELISLIAIGVTFLAGMVFYWAGAKTRAAHGDGAARGQRRPQRYRSGSGRLINCRSLRGGGRNPCHRVESCAVTRFRVLKWGADDLPAVVCVHTTGGHARRFERLARMLEPNRRVVAHDLRGHGRSPWSGPQTPAQHVADLDHVLDASGVDQVTIIGHGLGARIAVEHACEYGERATALVLLDPLILTPATTLLLLAERERGRGGFATISDAIEAERSESGLMHTPNALLEEEMAEHLVAGEDGLYRYRYSREAAASALSHAAESPPDLRAVVCPDADHPRRGVRAGERGRGRPGRGRASPWPGRDRSRRARRAVGCAGRDQRAGTGVRADSDACMSLRKRPMTAAEFEIWKASSAETYAREIEHALRLSPEQAAAKAATSFDPAPARRR